MERRGRGDSGRGPTHKPSLLLPRLSRQARIGWALFILPAIAGVATVDVGTQNSINLGSIDYALESQTFVGNGLEGLVAVRQKAIASAPPAPRQARPRPASKRRIPCRMFRLRSSQITTNSDSR